MNRYYLTIIIFSIMSFNLIATPPKQTIVIGEQTWMEFNLDVNNYRNGDPIRQANSVEEWLDAGRKEEGAWCYYNNDTNNGKVYGKLYNWFAVNDPRGLAPIGWHIPTEEEWQKLEKYLDLSTEDNSKYGNEFGNWQGAKLVGNSDLWTSTLLKEFKSYERSGFNALPGGIREGQTTFPSTTGKFVEYKTASFWLATSHIPDPSRGKYGRINAAKSRKIVQHFEGNLEYVIGDNTFKDFGLSVRCVQDIGKTLENKIVNNDYIIKFIANNNIIDFYKPTIKSINDGSTTYEKIITLEKNPDSGFDSNIELKLMIHNKELNNWDINIDYNGEVHNAQYKTVIIDSYRDTFKLVFRIIDLNKPIKELPDITIIGYNNKHSLGGVNFKFNKTLGEDNNYEFINISTLLNNSSNLEYLQDNIKIVPNELYKFINKNSIRSLIEIKKDGELYLASVSIPTDEETNSSINKSFGAYENIVNTFCNFDNNKLSFWWIQGSKNEYKVKILNAKSLEIIKSFGTLSIPENVNDVQFLTVNKEKALFCGKKFIKGESKLVLIEFDGMFSNITPIHLIKGDDIDYPIRISGSYYDHNRNLRLFIEYSTSVVVGTETIRPSGRTAFINEKMGITKPKTKTLYENTLHTDIIEYNGKTFKAIKKNIPNVIGNIIFNSDLKKAYYNGYVGNWQNTEKSYADCFVEINGNDLNSISYKDTKVAQLPVDTKLFLSGIETIREKNKLNFDFIFQFKKFELIDNLKYTGAVWHGENWFSNAFNK